jgi:hypothetical protein
MGRLAVADTITNFEQFTDGEQLTNQIPGLHFSNTTVVTAGISLNEFELPPHSGVNVAFDEGGPITISFDSPVLSFDGFFTHSVPLTIRGFGGRFGVFASVNSLFSSNLGLSGDPGSSPNEFLQIAFSSSFSVITITGDPDGGSFVMDDASFRSSIVPEPVSCVLGALGVLAVFGTYARRKA